MSISVLRFSASLVFLLGMFSGSLQAQASDAPGLPYHVPHILELFQDAIEHPTDTNAFVREYMKEEGFPKVKVGKVLNAEELNLIEGWITTEVEVIQRFQWDRKVNHDKFFMNN